MKKTNAPYTCKFKQYGEITVPAGTPVTSQTACGIDPNYNFVNSFGWVKRDYPQFGALLIHDLTHYGLNVPSEFVTN